MVIRIGCRSLAPSASKLRYPLVTVNNINLWRVSSCIFILLLHQQLSNLGVVFKWVNDSYYHKYIFLRSNFQHICDYRTRLGGS